jgi:hypothetical protein
VQGKRKEVNRVIRETVRRVFDGSDETERDPDKLRQVYLSLASAGFRISVKSTWSSQSVNRVSEAGWSEVEIGPDFDFTATECRWLRTEMQNVLKLNKNDAHAVQDATKYFIRYVYRNPFQETPISAIPLILADFPINWGKNEKKSRFVRLLIQKGWIYIISDYFNAAGKPGKRSRARIYGIGAEFELRIRRSFNALPKTQREPSLLSEQHQIMFQKGLL